MEEVDKFLKQQVEELIYLSKTDNGQISISEFQDLFEKIQKRLNYCGHCNGDTYDSGVCTNHFT